MPDLRPQPSPQAPPPAAALRARHEWLLLGLVLVAVGLFIGWERSTSRRDLETEQRQLLGVQARAVDVSLSRDLRGIDAALRGMRADLPDWPQAERAARASLRFKALAAAMPGLRTLVLLDRDGHALASNRDELIGRAFSDRDYFQLPRSLPDAERLTLTPPFATSLGSFTMALSLPLKAADGAFDGVVTATLDPEHVRSLLRAALYAADMRGGVVHGSGAVMLLEPGAEGVAGTSLDQPGSFFRRHRATGQIESVLVGTSAATADRRLTVLRSVSPDGLAIDQPIVIAVSRGLDAMFAPWWRQTLLHALLYALLAATTVMALLAAQRRQRAIAQLEAQRERQQRDSAERLELALRGADLGLWDLDVPSNTTVVNERWNSMLGLPHQAVYVQSEGWTSRIHLDDWDRVMAAQTAHLTGRSPRFEEVYRMRHADGHWVWVLDRAQVLERDAAGAPLRMAGTHMDTTQSMEAQLALERSEQNLATTLHSIGDAVIATDAQGRVVRMNAAAERLTGWPAAEAAGRPLGDVFRILSARTREPAVDPVGQVLAHGEIVGLANDTLLVARDGSEYQIADSAAPIRTPAGEITGVVLVFSDVTERYRVEQALRSNEQRLRSLLDNLGSGVIVHGADTHIIDANPSACRITGLSLEQMLGKVAIDPYWAFLEEDGSPMPLARFPVPQVLAADGPVKHLVLGVRRPDLDKPLWVLVNAYPVRDAEGRIEQVVVTFSDITERQEAEERIRQSEDLKTSVLDSLVAHIAVVDRDGVIVAVNEAWRRFARSNGGGDADPVGVSYLDACSAAVATPGHEDAGAALAGLQDVLAGARAEFHLEYPCHSPGEQRWFRMSVTPMRGRRGGAVISHMPVTELKRAEQRILAAQGELQATLEAIPDLLFEVDRDGVVHNFHSPRHELLYVPPAAFLGRAMGEVLPAAAAAAVRSALAEAEAAGFSTGQAYELALDDGPHWFELSVACKPVPPGEAPRFIALARDISERKQAEAQRRGLEQQVREAQKMESIGTLAGGIAHDFNNILPVILGNAAMALEDIAAGRPVQTNLEMIQKAGLRARSLVQQILTVSRRDQLGFTALPLAAIAEETLGLMRSTLPARVRLDAVLPEVPVTVHGNATQLQQVLMNLCTNAWHALPADGGRIEIGFARELPDDALRQRVADLPPGPVVHLWVSDNGCGMDDATRQRAFDPFFTTKPIGQGTGLGLSVVHGIVHTHGGVIVVDSAPGQGSTFHLYLPAPDAAPDTALPPPPERSAAPGRQQHVLYVDDDEVMMLTVERLLQRAGYRVTAESDARAALARIVAAPQDFDAIVTDFNMPELSGLEIAREVVRLRPALPVIISSGYISDELRAQATELGVSALMRKEHTFEELAVLLQRALGTPTPAA